MRYPRATHRRVRKQPDLSIAPLIDVVFLLLIFFMATTTFANRKGIMVEKPKAASAAQLRKVSLEVVINAKGEITVDGDAIERPRLRKLVAEHVRTTPRAAVVIEADRRADVGVLVEVLDLCKQAGAQRLAVGARKPTAGESP